MVQNPVYSTDTPQPVLQEPFWLVETIQKGRFSRYEIDPEEMYLLGFGNSQKFRVENFIS